MDTNPWQVDSIQEFYFLKCPECSFDTREEKYFHEHALQNHPLSIVFFGTKSEELFEANIEIPVNHFSVKSDSVDNELFEANVEIPDNHFPVTSENVANENSTPSHLGGTINKSNKQYFLSQKAVEVIRWKLSAIFFPKKAVEDFFWKSSEYLFFHNILGASPGKPPPPQYWPQPILKKVRSW